MIRLMATNEDFGIFIILLFLFICLILVAIFSKQPVGHTKERGASQRPEPPKAQGIPNRGRYFIHDGHQPQASNNPGNPPRGGSSIERPK